VLAPSETHKEFRRRVPANAKLHAYVDNQGCGVNNQVNQRVTKLHADDGANDGAFAETHKYFDMSRALCILSELLKFAHPVLHEKRSHVK